MHRPLVILTAAATLTMPVVGRADAASNDALRRQIEALSERLGRLESENSVLKSSNHELAARVAELEARVASDHADDAGHPDVTPVPVPVEAAGPPASPAARDATASPALPPAADAATRPWYEKVKVSGLLFGDAYAVLDNHDPGIDDRTGFWIRRGYLTFDSKLADEWSARLRFEVNSPGDFTTDSKLNPFVKDAYLEWKHHGQSLYLGLSPTPTFDFVESFWGQRPLEKTPLDLYRIGGSRDTGIAYKGTVASGRLFYHAMLGNGSGDGAETNDGKKFMGSVGLRPLDAMVLQLYADFEDRPGATDRITWQAFAGWQGARSRYGLQYAQQRRELEGATDEDVAVASMFGVWHLIDPGTLTVRYDRSFDGYADADKIPYLHIAPSTPFDLAILAWRQDLHDNISLIPSLEYVHYRKADGIADPSDDLYGRLTLHFEF